MILSNETYEMLETEIRSKLLPTTKHLVIVLGTPLVYPALKFFEDALEKLGDKLSRGSVIGKVFGKCKAFENVLGQFGPELLDDLVSFSSSFLFLGVAATVGSLSCLNVKIDSLSFLTIPSLMFTVSLVFLFFTLFFRLTRGHAQFTQKKRGRWSRCCRPLLSSVVFVLPSSEAM